jgi:hypothetical protein
MLNHHPTTKVDLPLQLLPPNHRRPQPAITEILKIGVTIQLSFFAQHQISN